ncbi:zinc ribbon domain-containing protein [Lacticaseibacillus songhuajiangensis]|jgi:predicted nucleic-acid-binding Zn-ribbon protein|uniref:zinc ribbon domain-containing protein n=1 Tax=Lacticaseibacillus songhuajiangensis TaxID=1296539 RepID=UPI000F79498A|nr:zinc ribbon domain-containing protein [Lacticaseibacillus songhuajiangensis]
MEKQLYTCVKCGGHSYSRDQLQATGGTFAKLMDVQNKKFMTISCDNCGYTELYKMQTSTGMNILDFLMSSN